MRSIRLYPFQQSNIFTCEQMFSLQKKTQRLKVIRVCISGQKKGETMVAKMWQTVVAKEDYILDFTKDVADSHLHTKNHLL